MVVGAWIAGLLQPSVTLIAHAIYMCAILRRPGVAAVAAASLATKRIKTNAVLSLKGVEKWRGLQMPSN